jgi:hypothetical protein
LVNYRINISHLNVLNSAEISLIWIVSKLFVEIVIFLTLISYTVSMVHLSSHLMFPTKYAFLYKTRRQ